MSRYISVSYDVNTPWVKIQRVLNKPVVIPPTPPPPPPITWLISGSVAESGTGFSAPLEITGLGTITSAASGSYGFLVVDGYSGTVIPHYASGTFDPLFRAYTTVGSNYPSQNYDFYPYPPPPPTYLISGEVSRLGSPLSTPVVFVDGTTPLSDWSLVTSGTLASIVNNASGAAYNPNTDSFWVPNNSTNALFEYASNGSYLRSIVTGGFADVEAVCWMYGSYFGILEEDTSSIVVAQLLPSTGSIWKWANQVIDTGLGNLDVLTGGGLEGVAYNPQQDVFYAVKERQTAAPARNGMKFYRIEWSGAYTEPWSAPAMLPSYITDLADIHYDPRTGRSYLLSDDAEAIIEVDTATGSVYQVMNWPSGMSQAEGLTFNPNYTKMWIVGEPNVLRVYTRDFVSITSDVSTGSYGYLVEQGWSGTSVPSYTDGTIVPNSYSYLNVGAAYPNQDFEVTYPPVTVQGVVWLDSVYAPLGTAVEFSGVGTFTQQLVDLQIRYLGVVPYGWTGTSSVPDYQPPNYTSTPGSYSYVNLTSSQTNQDFDITTNYFLISGTITNNGTGFSSALVTNFGTVTSAASGSYGYLVPGGYSGTTQPEYITTPGSYSYTNVASDLSDQNFDAPSPLLYFSSLDWIWSLPDPAFWNIQYFDTFGSFWDSWDMVPGTDRTYNDWDYDFSFRVIGYSGAGYNTGASNSVYIGLPVEISGTFTPGQNVYVTNGTATWLADFATGSYGYTVPSGWSGTTSAIDWITDPANRVYTNVTTPQPDQYLELTMPFLMVASNYFNWNTWSYEVPDRWFIYARNPVDLTYSVYATNAGTDYDINIADTGSYYHVRGVTAASNQATLDTADTYAAPPLPPVILLEGSVYSGTDGSGIISNLYVDGWGTISTDSFGYWNQGVIPPYTGYVAVADTGYDGTFNPPSRSYVMEMAPQSNQDFVFWPTAPAPTDCPVPGPLITMGFPTDLGYINPSRNVVDPVNSLLWVIDESSTNVFYFDLLGGTYAGSVTVNSPYGSPCVAYDAVNAKVLVTTYEGSLAFIDPVSKAVTYSNFTQRWPSFHMLAVDQYGTAYVCDNRNATSGTLYVVDCATEQVVQQHHLGPYSIYTDSICWAENINKLVINQDAPFGTRFFLFSPAAQTFEASVLASGGWSFNYENYYVKATGHVLMSRNGASAADIIDIINGTNATVIGNLTGAPTRVSDATEDTCHNRLFVSDGNYAVYEYSLDGSYTNWNMFDNGGAGLNPTGLAHSRATNLVYYEDWNDGTVKTLKATTSGGSIAGLVWTPTFNDAPPQAGGYFIMEGAFGTFSGTGMGDAANTFQGVTMDQDATMVNYGPPYSGTMTVPYTVAVEDSGTIDYTSSYSIYINIAGAYASVQQSYHTYPPFSNGTTSGTLVAVGVIQSGVNTFSISTQALSGASFSAQPNNTYASINGTVTLSPLTPP